MTRGAKEVLNQVGKEGTTVRMSPESAEAHNKAHPTGPVTEKFTPVTLTDGKILRVPQASVGQVLRALGQG